MGKFKKLIQNHKKSISSLFLALVMVLSFNYTPLTLVVEKIKSAVAYKATSKQTYYSTSSTSSESNIGTGVFPDELKEYFSNSSNNFNIQSYYETRFEDIYAEQVESFLKAQTAGKTDYDYEAFLNYYNSDTLYAYYTSNKTSLNNKYSTEKYSCESFINFVEKFVTQDTIYNDTGSENPPTFKAIYSFTDFNQARANFYFDFSGYIISKNAITSVDKLTEIPTTTIGYDNLAEGATTETFYKDSSTYGKTKDAIDSIIVKTVAIYSYDGVTQSSIVGAIIAEDAPISQTYYFKDGTFETTDVPNNGISKKYINTETIKELVPIVYCFDSIDSTVQNNADYKKLNNLGCFITESSTTLESNLFQYIQVRNGETGYIDADHPTYYKYSSDSPFLKTDSKVDLYLNIGSKDISSLTEDELATLNSLNITPITNSDITGSDKDFYWTVPYSKINTKYYEAVYDNSADTDGFSKFCELCAPESKAYMSSLYLKYSSLSTNKVYFAKNLNLDSSDNSEITASDFKDAYLQKNESAYKYTVIDSYILKSTENDKFYTNNDPETGNASYDEYFEITTDYQNTYYVSGYRLFFKKVKQTYQSLITDDSVYEKNGSNYVYEQKNLPKIEYETTTTPSKSYELNDAGTSRLILALALESDGEKATIEISSTEYKTIKQSDLDNEANRNIFVEVSEFVYAKIYGTTERTHKLYYQHRTETTNKIYLIPDTSEEKPEENEVYKNLYYTVITTSDYEKDASDYIEIAKDDSNYNASFKLYYKYSTTIDTKDIFVQNNLTGDNAIFISDDPTTLTSTERTLYRYNKYIVVSPSEFEEESEFYVEIPDEVNKTAYTLYYKYKIAGQENIVYECTTDTDSEYEIFSPSLSTYVASDYKLIEPGEQGYVAGKDLYYKKIRTEKYADISQNSYYYYQTANTVSLNANSYYMLSFYVNTTGENVEASVYVTDSKNAIADIALEHISTSDQTTHLGSWKKYVTFIATDSITASQITLSFYMGDKNSLLGSNYSSATSVESINGSVLFSNINVYLINETDFEKRTFNNEKIESTESQKDPTTEKETNVVDVVITNNTGSSFETNNVFDNRHSSNISNFNDLFKFENNPDLETQMSTLSQVSYSSSLYPSSELWQYYINKDYWSQGHNDELTQYMQAYNGGKLNASIILEETIDKTLINEDEDEDEEDEDENESSSSDSETEDLTDITSVTSTFNDNNKVLKLQNKNKLISLGLISNSFEVKPNEYYKLTVWIYSPDVKATATIKLLSSLNTANEPLHGSELSASASNVYCNITSYSTTPTNEYGWIPYTFYIEGNEFDTQNVYLVLMAGKNTTVYFDNIKIENTSSTQYSSNSSSERTYTLSLNPSTAYASNGVVGGYFNLTKLESDFRNPDALAPKVSSEWSLGSSNSTGVIAGIVSTRKNYVDETGNFYDLYNKKSGESKGTVPYSNGFDKNTSFNNVYGIYAPEKITSPLEGADDTLYNRTSNYSINIAVKKDSSTSTLSASSVYDITFDFYKGTGFTGTMVAYLYSGSVSTDKVIGTIEIDCAKLNSYQWYTFHFYVATSTSSLTTYIEIGVKNAVGTCFFKDVTSTTSTKTLDEIRDGMLTADSENKIYITKDSFELCKFIDFARDNFSMVADFESDENVKTPNDYTLLTGATSKYTTGNGGTAIATYYKTSTTTTYSVKIGDNTYYIGSSGEGTDITYNLYKYSDLKEADIITEIDDKKVTVESFKKVIVGENDNSTDYDTTENKQTNYSYYYECEYVLGDVIIPASELNNNYSQNVLILANSYGTDYNTATAKYTTTLDSKSYYIMKIYVKTSDFEDEDIGLNISISAIATNWDNVNTTKFESSKKDENGFVCYKVMISTTDNSISSLSVAYSLGTSSVTGKGYAIIAGSTIEKYSSEDEFNHFVEQIDEEDTTIKKYFASSTTTDSSEDETEEDEESVSWATFFYVFSSLLLGITLIMALIAAFIKKHPVKLSKKYKNDHDKDSDVLQITTSKKSQDKVTENKEFDDKGNGGII